VTRRIGLVADTHVPEAGPDLPPAAYDVLSGCDQILHCGDLHALEVVDRLERLAPTLVSRGNGDTASARGARPGVPEDPRVADTHVVTVEGLRIGLSHDLGHLEERDETTVLRLLEKRFGTTVDLAVSGDTHVPMVRGLAGGVVLVNPGSPTMPFGYRGVVGTVGVLEVSGTDFTVTVVDLATGTTQLELRSGEPHPLQRGPRPVGGR
jgi:putative phosphoesterase